MMYKVSKHFYYIDNVIPNQSWYPEKKFKITAASLDNLQKKYSYIKMEFQTKYLSTLHNIMAYYMVTIIVVFQTFAMLGIIFL